MTIVWFHLYETSGTGKSIETETRLLVTWGLVGGMGSVCCGEGYRVSFVRGQKRCKIRWLLKPVNMPETMNYTLSTGKLYGLITKFSTNVKNDWKNNKRKQITQDQTLRSKFFRMFWVSCCFRIPPWGRKDLSRMPLLLSLSRNMCSGTGARLLAPVLFILCYLCYLCVFFSFVVFPWALLRLCSEYGQGAYGGVGFLCSSLWLLTVGP